MALELLKGVNVQEGLEKLGEKAYSMKDNLVTRVETTVLKDETDLWKGTWLDSKDMNLYGNINEDNRHRLKIDHDYDLSRIVRAEINSDGSVSIADTEDEAKKIYTNSEGTEFIIIGQKDIKKAKADYAIKVENYKDLREQLNKGKFKVGELEEVGGFKINEWLKPDEISIHNGWKELAVGKNNASVGEYAEASQFLEKEYVPKAQKNGCFPDGTGMGFFVRTDEKGYKVRPWCVSYSYDWSYASDWGDFYNLGSFLRVLDKSAKGDDARKIITLQEDKMHELLQKYVAPANISQVKKEMQGLYSKQL